MKLGKRENEGGGTGMEGRKGTERMAEQWRVNKGRTGR